uniref:Uncharacterized protein n=1 Tax=Acrobeloides nanus TaxID=290746 RepID=A0A914DCP3_9BILA
MRTDDGSPGSLGPNASWGRYLVGHHLLLAHANAYHIYKNEFKDQQKGEVGIALVGPWCDPLTDNPEDVEASLRAFDHNWNWFANPIFHPEGDYPKRMKERLAELSKKEGRIRSRLPEFTKEEIESLKGSADFLAFNHYLGLIVRNRLPEEYTSKIPMDELDGGFVLCNNPGKQ